MTFLALVSGRLTIYGRAFELDLAAEQQIVARKGLNEIQHRISFQIAGMGTQRDRYPDDAFLEILFENASSFSLATHLAESFDYVKTGYGRGEPALRI